MPENTIEVGGRRQLFLDDYAIASRDGVRCVLHGDLKHEENPILVADKPWETLRIEPGPDRRPGRGASVWFNGTVLWDDRDRQYKMWYRTWNHLMGYAVSGDGLHWQKPNLGYVEFAGDYDTNLVFDKYQCPSIVLDAQDQNPEKRFKMLYGGRGPLFKKATYQRGEANYGKHGVGLMVAYSPDGVRWWRDPHDVVWPYNLYMPGIPSDGLAVIYDRYKGKYAAYDCAKPRGSVHEEYVDRASDWGIDLIHDEGVVRQMIVSYSVDGLIWSEPVGVLAPDEEDRRRYGDRVQFYDLSVRLYEGIYVGYLWVWPIEPDWMQIELVTSRDGLHWKRVADRELFIRTGPKGTFDSHLIMGVSIGADPVVVGDEIWIYYSGWDGGHAAWKRNAAIGVVRLRSDGWLSLDADESGGSVVTKPFVCPGGSLFLNADADADREGRVEVEILSATGSVVSGYAASEAIALRGDSIRHQVRWRGRDDVDRLKGRMNISNS